MNPEHESAQGLVWLLFLLHCNITACRGKMRSGGALENRAELFSMWKIPTWKIILLRYKCFQWHRRRFLSAVHFIFLAVLPLDVTQMHTLGLQAAKHTMLQQITCHCKNEFSPVSYFLLKCSPFSFPSSCCSGPTSSNCGPVLIALTCAD